MAPPSQAYLYIDIVTDVGNFRNWFGASGQKRTQAVIIGNHLGIDALFFHNCMV